MNRWHNIGTTQNRLRWYGHVLQKGDNDQVNKCMHYHVYLMIKEHIASSDLTDQISLID